jgi:hypothetical protein
LGAGNQQDGEGDVRIVTTCNADGFKRYGHRLLKTWHHWPMGTELYWYVEGFSLPADKPDGITEISTDKLQDLQAFKLRHGNYVAPNYLYDVVRFSHKVYAAIDALRDYHGVGVWLDADCVTPQPIPDGYIEGHLRDAYLALIKRKGMYTETGFWIMDCRHEQHVEFLSAWQSWYDGGGFKALANWTDCETLDATVRKFERASLIKTVSLSGEHEKQMHPLSKTELGKYIVHLKGGLKDIGHIPEDYKGVA